jgi:dTDP-3,4-didehydro-2,6-dideoxy-alpha-D-glucose 3-reductase
MTKKLRIGILGCASIARRSMIPAILNLGNYFELAGIASRDASKAALWASEFGCDAYDDYSQLVTASDVDALYIPLPSGLHKEWINKALLAGKHVYAEKAFATCYQDADQMVMRAHDNCLTLMEGYMFQYHSQHQIVKQLLASGVIGELRHFHSSFGFPPLPKNDFRYNNELGGGVLLDAAGYPLRATHFLLGEHFEVKAATLYHNASNGTQIYGSAFLANPQGVGASLVFGFDNFYQCRYELIGQTGKITAERAFTPRFDFCPKIIVETASGNRTIEAEPDNHFVKALLKFHAATGAKEVREALCREILLQSKSLELIKKLGLPSGSDSQ